MLGMVNILIACHGQRLHHLVDAGRPHNCDAHRIPIPQPQRHGPCHGLGIACRSDFQLLDFAIGIKEVGPIGRVAERDIEGPL